ncbi:hypothetical protein B0H15DRAFT_803328 [Mycena belliarum]|uniref:Uncharacterized protein n=1 Tax=Mycena belliarum TaxID=1033014 RepID=A0AAD6XRC0_9AGAR|nr:hypothetical protein B0H15DRAFT_803328 [Mycena belliae]
MIRAQGALSGTSPKSCLYGKHVHVHFVDFSGIRTSWLHRLITEVCPKGIDACATSLVRRERLHKPNTDHMNIDPTAGWITIGESRGSSFGPARLNYKAFMCYDLLDGGKQTLSEYGVWTVDNFTLGAKGLGQTHLNLSVKRIGGVYKSGAPLPYDGTPKQVTIRVVVSFVSTDQAYTTTKSEVGNSSSEDITSRPRRFGTRNSRRRKPRSTFPTPENVTEMLYSSRYRSTLTPNNAAGESQGLFAGTPLSYFDSLYCSWDTMLRQQPPGVDPKRSVRRFLMNSSALILL